MVKGVPQLKAKFDNVPKYVRDEVVATMEKSAMQLAAEAKATAPIPEIDVNYTWGDTPKGALKVGSVMGSQYGKISVKVYATATDSDFGSFPAIAKWFEFGTGPRVQKTTGRYTGQIQPQPYFFPTYRANKTRITGAISRAVTRAVKKANKK